MQQLLVMSEFQCHSSSFGIWRAEGKGKKEKAVECSTDKTCLIKPGKLLPSLIIISVFLWPLLYPEPFMVGLAINGEVKLLSFPTLLVMMPPALGKETILNDAIVAIAAKLCCFISTSIPTLSLAENAPLNFLSSYIYGNMHKTSKSVSRSQVIRSCSIQALLVINRSDGDF